MGGMNNKDTQIERLMIEKLAGVISKEDDGYLEELIRNDEVVADQWLKVKETFFNKGPCNVKEINAETAWRQVSERIENKKNARKSRNKTWRVAASLMIPIVLGTIFYFYTSNKAPFTKSSEIQVTNNVKLLVDGYDPIDLSLFDESKSPSLNNVDLKVDNEKLSYSTRDSQKLSSLNILDVPQTKTYQVTLSDGTEVALNAMSQLKFPFAFSGDKREVWLAGEAYFDVAEDKDHPFIVHTPLTDVTVLGTEFNINTYDSSHITTSLVRGSVHTQVKNGAEIQLKPGYEAVFSRFSGFDVQTFDQQSVLSWRQGIYYFQNTPLKEIVPVIRRWYGDSIRFDDDRVTSKRFTGALLKHKPLSEFLENLVLTSNIRYQIKSRVITLSIK